jgi:DNA repair protein RadD
LRALETYFNARSGNPLIVLPTGCGKALTIATFIKEAITTYPGTRIINATHVRELVFQNYQEFLGCDTGIDAGIYSAGLKRRDLSHPVIFAGIQSIYKRAFEFGRVDLLVVDEAHTISRDGQSRWGQFIKDLRVTNPYLKVIGFTATAFRLDSGALIDGEEALFDDIVYEYGLLQAVQEGYLAPVVPKWMATTYDISSVHKRGGEYVPGELERSVDVDELTQSAVREICEYGSDRRSWLVFCAGVKHAGHVTEALRARGVTAAAISDQTASGERDTIINQFKAGQIRAVCNVGILTTGFNYPALDLIACLRHTQSAGLWVQMLGRGMRLAPGKKDALVLDFARNSDRFGPLDQIRAKRKGEKGGDAPVKICPECDDTCFAGVRLCPSCGFEFPEPEPKFEREASEAALLSDQAAQPVWHPVTAVTYVKHEKDTPSLRACYQSGLKQFNEWICLAHTGRAREKASAWWARRGGQLPAPRDIDTAVEMARELPAPKRIAIKKNGKYSEVVAYDFG